MADMEGMKREAERMERMRQHHREDELHAMHEQQEHHTPARPTQQTPPPQRPRQGPKIASEADLIQAINTWDFSGLDLSGDYSHYKALAHLKNEEGKVTAKELLDKDALIEQVLRSKGLYRPPQGLDQLDEHARRDALEKWVNNKHVALGDHARQVGKLNLSNTNLSNVDLTHADFNFSRDLVGPSTGFAVNLSGANLSKANLQGADMTSCILDGADMRGTRAQHSTFSGAYLSGVQFDDKTDMAHANISEAKSVPKDLKDQAKLQTKGARVALARQNKGLSK